MQLETLPNDPLLWDFDLPLHTVYHPLGFPLEVVTNSADVLAAAEESWGMFRKIFSVPRLQIRVGVLPGTSKRCPSTPVCRGQRNLFIQVADGENHSISDTREGFAFGWLTEATVQNRAYLRYHFLEGTAWMLLESLYLTSVNAACVELDGHGVLLCGDEGAGKSSLAYACARNGWRFLCDDSTMLLRKRGGRLVTGNPYQMRFRDSAADLFAELRNQRLTPQLNGQFSIELATATMPDIAIVSECAVDYLVFLNRHEPEPAGLSRFSRESSLRWLEQVVCFGEQHVRDEHKAALRDLVMADVLEMRYSQVNSALCLLERLVHCGPSVAK